jgi:hypothetical protein
MNKLTAITLSLIIILLFSFLALPAYINLPDNGYGTPSPEWDEALTWLRCNTPEGTKILTWWDYGYWIRFTACRVPLVTPSQEAYVKVVAGYLVSHENPSPPGDTAYVIIDKNIAGKYMPAILGWAGKTREQIHFTYTLAYRLFSSPDSVSGYHLVFDNSVKIFKYSNPEGKPK